MPTREPKLLTIAVRVYPTSDDRPAARSKKDWQRPAAMFVFDTETRIDATQRLILGSSRFIVAGRCLEECLFHADDLPEEDQQVLKQYVATHSADVVGGSARRLRLLTCSEFLEKLFRNSYKARSLLVGFNLPFDLSRIAHDFTTARARFAGGFSLGLWLYRDKAGREQADKYRPRIGIKYIDNKRSLMGFTSRKNPDETDLIPEGSTTGEPERGYKFRGHFLDLRTLAFALTDRGYSLEKACEVFGVEHGKHSIARHGIITEEYIDYNRRDVLATSELALKLIEEYDKHPIKLQETKAFSPASIGKAYLRAMGIPPILERQPDFPKAYLGYAQTAFFGGRTSAHARKVTLPIAYVDFLSMYPTVNNLMGLWPFVTAREIRVVEHCGTEIRAFLAGLTPDDLFKPQTWRNLTAFVQVIPNGDTLPTRGKYSVGSNDWQVAINNLHAEANNPKQALWFSLPDIAASVLLSGRIPNIVDAFRIEPMGTFPGLTPTKLRGAIEVDPRSQDFFKVVIEERKRVPLRTDLPDVEKERLDKALKVLANAASYGIYAEMNRKETDQKVIVTCHGIDVAPFSCRVAHPDVPGEYCFPPLASLITGGARLMLALLEHCVTELGGTYAMEDTDSMAIVATEHGGMVPCPGGPHKMETGRDTVRALSWKQVEQISECFAPLNPYDLDAVPGSILKIENDNFDPITGKQRQLYCFAISAKRYAPFLLDENGNPVLLRKEVNNKEDRWSKHGLGHLLNPTDPQSDNRDWIAQVWEGMIRRALGLPTQPLSFEHLPAIGRVTISSPAVMRPIESFNSEKQYSNQIKPFNFLLTCHVRPFGHPIGSDAERFHLIAPYESDPRRWLDLEWIDQYTGRRYGVTTDGHHGTCETARVKTYGDVLREYEFHPESKCADADGKPSGKQTIGLLQRRHVGIEQIKNIGKESNSLEDVESGTIHSAQIVYTEYPDPRRDEWQTKIVPALKKMSLATLERESGLSRRTLIDARTGRRRPHRRNQEILSRLCKKLNLI
jgi:hypothetical protein